MKDKYLINGLEFDSWPKVKVAAEELSLCAGKCIVEVVEGKRVVFAILFENGKRKSDFNEPKQ